ncbi:MAG TPA: GTP-sensing pleiotropic transcriptional regulator CodY [Firmicutes bacterium]|nr:GTP-sensing pleiotropic transcriptional regulator CodY [Bacillota bacterium]
MGRLLESTRRINEFIQESGHYAADFKELMGILAEEVEANAYLIDREGKILGHGFSAGSECEAMGSCTADGNTFPKEFNDKLLKMIETSENISETGSDCFLWRNVACPFRNKFLTVVPIFIGEERLATLLLVRFDREFSEDDLVIAEHTATLVGMVIVRLKSEKLLEESRKRAAVHMALETLSYSEQEAVEHIFDELNGQEGLLVASKIADKVGITRSVIVNALRKFESAGVIESRSLGMKGTYIRVLNDKLFDELERLRAR